jgi:hypothetical protein
MGGAVIGKAVAAGARAALRAAMSLGGKLTAKKAAEFARQQLTSIISKFGLKLKNLAVKQARNTGIKAGKGKRHSPQVRGSYRETERLELQRRE